MLIRLFHAQCVRATMQNLPEGVRPMTRFVLQSMLSFCDFDGVCRVTEVELSRHCGVTTRSVRRSVSELRELGYVGKFLGVGRREMLIDPESGLRIDPLTGEVGPSLLEAMVQLTEAVEYPF